MVNFNGSNAYKMRYEDGAAQKKKKEQPAAPAKKHIRPNMTVKLNRKRETKPALAPKRPKSKVRSLNDGEIRMLFAAGFAFFVFITFFAFTMRCHANDNELTLIIESKKQMLASLEHDYSVLVVKRDNLLSEAAVEAYASQNLGMQKRDNHQMKWFEVSWGDDFDD